MKLSKEQIEKLAVAHIRHYKNLIYSPSKFVNGGECHKYAEIWQRVLESINEDLPIGEQGKREIYDAVFSGDYEYITGKLLDGDTKVEYPEGF